MKLNDKLYNIFKWSLFTFVPEIILLISALGSIYKFDTEAIILTISAVASFIGAITGLSNYNYKKLNK